jgi:hypothetical protein
MGFGIFGSPSALATAAITPDCTSNPAMVLAAAVSPRTGELVLLSLV